MVILTQVAAPAPWAITSPAVARPLPLRAGDRYVTRWRPGQNGFVRAIDDPYPFERGHSGEKRVATSRVRVDGNDQDVVVKSMKPYRGSNGTMHLETLYLEFLRGEPGIPWLCGCRADIPQTRRGDAVATTWIFRGDAARRRRGD